MSKYMYLYWAATIFSTAVILFHVCTSFSQFYSAVSFASTNKICIAVLGNCSLALFITFIRYFCTLFLGDFSTDEKEHIKHSMKMYVSDILISVVTSAIVFRSYAIMHTFIILILRYLHVAAEVKSENLVRVIGLGGEDEDIDDDVIQQPIINDNDNDNDNIANDNMDGNNDNNENNQDGNPEAQVADAINAADVTADAAADAATLRRNARLEASKAHRRRSLWYRIRLFTFNFILLFIDLLLMYGAINNARSLGLMKSPEALISPWIQFGPFSFPPTIYSSDNDTWQTSFLFFGEYCLLIFSVIRSFMTLSVNAYEIAVSFNFPSKPYVSFYIDMIIDSSKLGFIIGMVFYIGAHTSLPLHYIRDGIITLANCQSRLSKFLNYRTILQQVSKNFTDISPQELQAEDIICVVCRDVLKVGENCKKTHCNHMYHFDCLKDWMERSENCPVCQRPLLKKDTTTGNVPTPVFQAPIVPPPPVLPAPVQPADINANGDADLEAIFDNVFGRLDQATAELGRNLEARSQAQSQALSGNAAQAYELEKELHRRNRREKKRLDKKRLEKRRLKQSRENEGLVTTTDLEDMQKQLYDSYLSHYQTQKIENLKTKDESNNLGIFNLHNLSNNNIFDMKHDQNVIQNIGPQFSKIDDNIKQSIISTLEHLQPKSNLTYNISDTPLTELEQALISKLETQIISKLNQLKTTNNESDDTIDANNDITNQNTALISLDYYGLDIKDPRDRILYKFLKKLRQQSLITALKQAQPQTEQVQQKIDYIASLMHIRPIPIPLILLTLKTYFPESLDDGTMLFDALSLSALLE